MTKTPGEPPFDAISDLVLECLDRMEQGGSAAVDEVCNEHPDQADALRSRLARLLGIGLIEDQAELEVPDQLGDFRLGACLGGGGMGVVYAAEQESLGRQVALKLIRPEQLFFPESRERFRREVEVVARLAHPGIVPVYMVGEERGLPYFAMELVVGATLAEILEEVVTTQGDDPRALTGSDMAAALGSVLQRREKAGGPATDGVASPPDVDADAFGRTWADACLTAVARVARALDHAHERGVLHRDLKPSNVMLTPDGRALLFDFGLASASDVTRMTRTGSQVGSLPYMAPEQLRGDGVDERTDVYGLGALLCELLTFAPPHGAQRGEALVKAILSGEPVRLRERNPSLSRDTETVVQQALERDPARRYATAAAFGRDLENVLARRPIDARRAGPAMRSVRWAQRHPARAAAGALALALAIGLPTSIAIQRGAANIAIQEALDEANAERARTQTALEETSRERERTAAALLDVGVQRDRAEAALLDASAERDRAEANLDQALVALDTFLYETGHRFLGDVPGMELARLRLLEQAEDLLDDLMPQQAGDPVMRQRFAAVQRGKAEALERLGRLPEAVSHYQTQLAVIGELRVADPADEAYFALQVTGLNNLANALSRQGDDAASLEALREARDLLQSRAEPDRDLREISVLERNIALALERLRHFDEAHVAYAASIAAAAKLLERTLVSGDRDEQFAAYREHAFAVAAHAQLVQQTGGPRAAWSLYERALPVALKLVEARPELPQLAHEAALVTMNAGTVLSELGRDADAEEVLRYGLTLSERLVRDFPDTPGHVRPLAGTCVALGLVLSKLGRPPDEVEALWVRAVEATRSELERFPEDYDLREAHAVACVNLASHYVGQRRPTEGIAPAAEGQASADLVLLRRPEDARMQWCAGWLRIQEAYGRIAEGDRARAEAVMGEALELVPTDPRAHVASAEVLAMGFELLVLEGAEAEAQAERAFEHLARGVELGYDNEAKLAATWERGPLAGRPELAEIMERVRGRARP